ncbi:uncharacterized protein [Dermacentor albipictus]
MSSIALPRTRRRAQYYGALEFLVMVILSTTILVVSSCSIDCPHDDKPRSVCADDRSTYRCNCTCVPQGWTCPPLESQLMVCGGGKKPNCSDPWTLLGETPTCHCFCR